MHSVCGMWIASGMYGNVISRVRSQTTTAGVPACQLALGVA